MSFVSFGYAWPHHAAYPMPLCAALLRETLFLHVQPANLSRRDSELRTVISEGDATRRLFSDIEINGDCSAQNLCDEKAKARFSKQSA